MKEKPLRILIGFFMLYGFLGFAHLFYVSLYAVHITGNIFMVYGTMYLWLLQPVLVIILSYILLTKYLKHKP